jgi:hypothetical protein
MAMECTDEAGVVFCVCFQSKRALGYCSFELTADIIALAKVSPKDINHLGYDCKGILGA